MSSLRDSLGPSGRMLARRLGQLCTTLEELSVRLHGTIATAIGETIGGIVRDTALRILDDITHDFPGSPCVYRPPRDRIAQNRYEPDHRGYWPEEDDDVAYDRQSPDRPVTTERLPPALAAGLQAASWWLRRWYGRSRLVTTLAVAALATGIAFLGGPLAVAVLTLVGSATQITSLSDLIGPGDPAYNRYGPA